MKKVLAVILVSVMAVSLFGCGTSSSSSSSTSSASSSASSSALTHGINASTDTSSLDSTNTSGKKYKIGFIIEEMSPFMSQTADAAEAFGKEHSDVTVTVAVADNDVAKELSDVENFIADGYDAIVMKPLDSEGCAPAVQYCKDANIPIIAMNNNFAGVEATSYVGSNHELSGEYAAEGVAEALNGKGKVVVLEGDMSQQAAIDRMDGVKKVLSEKYPDIEIVDAQDAGWSTDTALTKTENWISSGTKFDGIIACASQMAVGAKLALEQGGYSAGQIPIASIDAMQMSLEIYKTGWVCSDVLQDAYGQGYTAMKAAYKILNGGTVDSYIDVPYVPVTKDQIDTYLARYTGSSTSSSASSSASK